MIDALVQGDPEEKAVRAQLDGSAVKKQDYTRVGLCTEILVMRNRVCLSKSNRYIEETLKVHLELPALNDGAGILL